MRKILIAASVAGVMLFMSCSEKKVDPVSNLSTNPADCRLSKINFSGGGSISYTYNADGNISEMLDGGFSTTFLYTNGVLSSQKNSLLELKYTYTNADLSNIEFLDGAGAKLGDFVVTLTPNKQISTLTVANPNATYKSFNGVITTYSYDAAGNNTLIEVKNGTTLIAKTEYGSFVNVRSHLITLKGLIFSNYNSPLAVLEQAPFWKYPNTSPNTYKRSTTLDANLQVTATMSVVDDFTYERIANESGVQKERKTIGGGSAAYEYTGCK